MTSYHDSRRVILAGPLRHPIHPLMEYGALERVVVHLASALGDVLPAVSISAVDGSCGHGGLFDPALAVAAMDYEAQAIRVHELIHNGGIAGDAVVSFGRHALYALTKELCREDHILATIHGPGARSGPSYGAIATRSQARVHFAALSEHHRRALDQHLHVRYVIPNGGTVLPAEPPFSDERHLLVLGRVCATKGVHHAISLAQRAEIPLVIAGPVLPSDMSFFEEQVRPSLSEQIHYIGPVNDRQKASLFASAVALIHLPTEDEPSSLVTLEAIANGVPVISAGGGAVREIVEPGINGALGESPSSLLEELDEVLRLDSASVASHAAENHSWRRAAVRCSSALEDIRTKKSE